MNFTVICGITKEDVSSLPLPARKFEGDESNHLGQLFVTPEMISKKNSDDERKQITWS